MSTLKTMQFGRCNAALLKETMSKKKYTFDYAKLGIELKKVVLESNSQLVVHLVEIGISDSTYHNLVYGKTNNITVETFLKITNWLGMNPSEFYK